MMSTSDHHQMNIIISSDHAPTLLTYHTLQGLLLGVLSYKSVTRWSGSLVDITCLCSWLSLTHYSNITATLSLSLLILHIESKAMPNILINLLDCRVPYRTLCTPWCTIHIHLRGLHCACQGITDAHPRSIKNIHVQNYYI